MKISGLQPMHFVRAGGRVLKPTERVRSHVTKWLDNNKVPMDLNTFENLFVVGGPGTRDKTRQAYMRPLQA